MASLDPTKGSEQSGTRPVLVISRDAINRNSGVIVIVPLSDRSNFHRIYPSQLALDKGTAGLTMNSVCMCEQIRAITIDRLKARLGILNNGLLEQIEDRLKVTLDLD